jgi:DNA-binding SARP family transcriptional activator
MIHLHTLGETLITVGEKEVRPSAPLVFAALLYLGVERGRRVPRAALRELFFPESDERSGSHSVRQLLYKLRQLGAPLNADDTSVALDASAISDAMAMLDSAPVDLLRGGFLPSYRPEFSEAFSEWVRSSRDHGTARIIRAVAARMTRAYVAGSEAEALSLAAILLLHDPLNEEATLTKAKLLAGVGQKQKALAVLEEYSAEVGSELRLPAELLRKRMQVDIGRAAEKAPLVGRELDLQQLLASYRQSVAGTTTLSLIWGEAGIGKSRLAQEFAARVNLEGTRVVWAFCQEHTIGRPLGALTDFIPGLLQCRGALGVSPRSMEWLKRLEVRVESSDVPFSYESTQDTSRQLAEATLDLLACVCSEGPVLLVLEDAQWLDEASRDFLFTRLAPDLRLHLLITSRNERLAAQKTTYGDGVSGRKLDLLSRQASEALLLASLGDTHHVDQSMVSDCVALAAGNPLFVRTLAHHLASCGDLPSAKARIPDLMSQRLSLLPAPSLLLLRSVAVLGTLATAERIKNCVAVPEYELLMALQDLADRGLVITQANAVVCSHQILVDTVIANTPLPLLKTLYYEAATKLETEGKVSRHAGLLWSCAEYWVRCDNPRRAAGVLRECGWFAMELGQARYAIPAMERAQDLCSDGELRSIVEETIRIADLAMEDDAIIRHVHKYRSLSDETPQELLHFSELAEIRALRRLGHDIWNHRDRLLGCALAPSVPLKERRRAARTYLISAEEGFGGREATLELASLAPLWNDQIELDAVELKMLVNLIVGETETAIEPARVILGRIEEYPLTAQPVTLSAVARTLFAAGLTDESIAVSRRELELARQIDSSSDIAMAAARLADTYLTIGDIGNARSWINTTKAHVGSSDFAFIYHLYNSIRLAIADATFADADELLETLRGHQEAQKKHAIRDIAGMAIILANARGALQTEVVDLEALLRLDDDAWCHSEHLVFAVGLFLLLTSKGFDQQARFRIREYFTLRRRERYDPWVAIAPMHLTGTQLSLLKDAVGNASAKRGQPLLSGMADMQTIGQCAR